MIRYENSGPLAAVFMWVELHPIRHLASVALIRLVVYYYFMKTLRRLYIEDE